MNGKVPPKPLPPAKAPHQAHNSGTQGSARQPQTPGQRGGRPVGFDRERYRRRNEVERTINRLKNSRAVAIRYGKRAYVFHGTVTAAAIRLWLRP
ncbi:hypothetical protein GCM10018966_003200 [Streptomyces yanii]